MRIFVLTLILALLAAVALRVWIINIDEEAQRAEIPLTPPDHSPSDSVNSSVSERPSRSNDDTEESPEDSVPANQDDEMLIFYGALYSEPRDIIAYAGFEPDQFLADAEVWLTDRGMGLDRAGLSTGIGKMQPYHQYDNETLLGFAESGDMWAQQILGTRLLQERPSHAIELLTLAAENGSVTAMQRLGAFYSQLTRLNEPAELFVGDGIDDAREIMDQTSDLYMEAARWMGAAEISSGGMFRGPDSDSGFGQRPDRPDTDQRNAMCDAALDTYNDIRNAQIAAGRSPGPTTAPPWFVDSGESGYCGSPDWPRPDTSRCKQIGLVQEEAGIDEPFIITLCPTG